MTRAQRIYRGWQSDEGGWKTLILLILWAAFFVVVLSSCGEPKRTVSFIPTPPERLICERTGTRPTIPAEYSIDWTKVTTVAQAHSEFDKYRAVVLNREGVVAAYVLKLEGANFLCWSNMLWRRDWEADLAKTHPVE